MAAWLLAPLKTAYALKQWVTEAITLSMAILQVNVG